VEPVAARCKWGFRDRAPDAEVIFAILVQKIHILGILWFKFLLKMHFK